MSSDLTMELAAARTILGELHLENDELSGELASMHTAVGNLLAIIHRDGGQYVDKHGTLQACADAIEVVGSLRTELMELAERHRWIPVEERLPESRALVCVYVSAWPELGFWFEGRWYTKSSASPVGGGGYSTGRVVTHWRPIDAPEPLSAAPEPQAVQDVPPDPAVLMDALHGSVHKDEGPENRGRLLLRSVKTPSKQE